MEWEQKIQEKFKGIIAKMPVFHRRIAEEAIIQRAEENARARKASQVEEQDVVAAFFTDVPSPFYSMMIRLLEQSRLDYKKYGFPKNPALAEHKNMLRPSKGGVKIAVIGSGAIGGLVAAYLKNQGEDVVLLGHAAGIRPIKEKGLEISGVRGDFDIKLDVAEKLNFKPELAILAVKTQDLNAAIKDNLGFLKDGLVLTTQNGVQADNLAAKYILPENLVSSIVMFGATYLEAGKIVHNFEGSWIIGASTALSTDGERSRTIGRLSGTSDEKLTMIESVLNQIFPTVISDDICGMKYLKIFVNANNCIPAILGLSMQEAFKDLEISRISIGIWKEGLEVVKKCGIKLVSLPDFPLERLTKLASLPEAEAAKIFSGIMVNLSKEPVYGSILQSIKRNRASEIDYINGEFVNLAKAGGFSAPLNQRLVGLVHRIEKTRQFLSQEELINDTKGVMPV